MKQARGFLKEIHQGKISKENLAQIKERTCFIYGEYAALELVFSSFLLMEEIQEQKMDKIEDKREIARQVNAALAQFASEEKEPKKLIIQLRKLRAEITEKMNLLTAYADRLICYEYVLNRMEIRFEEPEVLEQRLAALDEQEFMQKIIFFLFSSQDPVVIKEKIRQILGQLPVRLTKVKFYERLKETLALFEGAEKSSLDEFVYMIKTSAMLYEPEQSGRGEDETAGLLRELGACDFAHCNKETYEQLQGRLRDHSIKLQEQTDFYSMLQQVVNRLYAMILCQKNKNGRGSLETKALELLRNVSVGKAEPDDFVPLEGKIEELVEKIGLYEAVLQEVVHSCKAELEEMNLLEPFGELIMAAQLLSGSLFIDLERGPDESLVSNCEIKAVAAGLIREFEGKFETCGKSVRRAIMAKVCEKFPPDFKNTTQVEEFIRQALFLCQDKAERIVSAELIHQIIEEF